MSESDRIDLSQVTRTEFINAMTHLYRGALADSSVWRTRIDTTSNWAIILSASALTFSFSETIAERHVLILIIGLFCTGLLLMEARRYRTYDIWRSRARMLERCFYIPMMVGRAPDPPDWAERLADDLMWPTMHLPMWEAVGRRLRRNYQWIYGVLLVSWVIKLMTHPTPSTSVREILVRASVGPVPGEIVAGFVALFYAALIALGVFSLWASRYRRSSLPAGHPLRMGRANHPDS